MERNRIVQEHSHAIENKDPFIDTHSMSQTGTHQHLIASEHGHQQRCTDPFLWAPHRLFSVSKPNCQSCKVNCWTDVGGTTWIGFGRSSGVCGECECALGIDHVTLHILTTPLILLGTGGAPATTFRASPGHLRQQPAQRSRAFPLAQPSARL